MDKNSDNNKNKKEKEKCYNSKELVVMRYEICRRCISGAMDGSHDRIGFFSLTSPISIILGDWLRDASKLVLKRINCGVMRKWENPFVNDITSSGRFKVCVRCQFEFEHLVLSGKEKQQRRRRREK